MKKASLWEIYKIYFIIGLQLLGGGYVIMPLLKKYLIEERDWLKEEDLIDYLALSQCLPGLIALNISVFSGYALRKIKGAIMAVVGLVTTPFIIILLVASFIFNVSDNKYVQDAFFGIRLSIIVLIFSMVADIFKASVNSKFSLFIFLLIFILGLFSILSPTMLVILSVLIAIIYYKIKEEKKCLKHIFFYFMNF